MAPWIERLLTLFDIARRGVLVLVDHARDDHLATLLRALRGPHPDASVITALHRLESLPVGAVVVLIPAAHEADALNLARPLFERRRLRVVLWCASTVSAALAEGAPDFFNWISARVECPSATPWFTLATLRAAHDADIAGVVWLSPEAPDEALREAGLACEPRVELSGSGRSVALALAAAEETSWIWVDGVDSEAQMLTLRLVLADAQRRGRVIVSGRFPSRGEQRASLPVGVNDDAARPNDLWALGGWTLVDTEVASLRSLPDGLDVDLAIALRGEPEATRFTMVAAELAPDPQLLRAELESATDPGAALAARVLREGEWADELRLGVPAMAPPWLLDLGPTFLCRASWADPTSVGARIALRMAFGSNRPLLLTGHGDLWHRWWASKPLGDVAMAIPDALSTEDYGAEVILWWRSASPPPPPLGPFFEAVRLSLRRWIHSGEAPPAQRARDFARSARYDEAARALRWIVDHATVDVERARARLELSLLPGHRDLDEARDALRALEALCDPSSATLREARVRLMRAEEAFGERTD